MSNSLIPTAHGKSSARHSALALAGASVLSLGVFAAAFMLLSVLISPMAKASPAPRALTLASTLPMATPATSTATRSTQFGLQCSSAARIQTTKRGTITGAAASPYAMNGPATSRYSRRGQLRTDTKPAKRSTATQITIAAIRPTTAALSPANRISETGAAIESSWRSANRSASQSGQRTPAVSSRNQHFHTGFCTAGSLNGQ